MERLTGPDLPEDDLPQPDTEPAGQLQLPPGGPPTALATGLLGSGPEWEDSDYAYGDRIGVLGRAARAVLAILLLGVALLFSGRWYFTLALIVVALHCMWIAFFAEGVTQSAYRAWQRLQQRRHERRLTRSAGTSRRAA